MQGAGRIYVNERFKRSEGSSQKMAEITIDVPKDIKEIVAETGKAISETRTPPDVWNAARPLTGSWKFVALRPGGRTLPEAGVGGLKCR